jgi:hypothetical protein
MKVKVIQCESGRVAYKGTKGVVVTTTEKSLRLIGRNDNECNYQLWRINEEGEMYLLEQRQPGARVSFWAVGGIFKISVSI